MRIGFYIDCTPKSGMGHLYRSLGLAKLMQQRGHSVFIGTSSFFGDQIAASFMNHETVMGWANLQSMILDWLVVDKIGAIKVAPATTDKYCFVGATGSKVDKDTSKCDLIVCGGIPYDQSYITDKWLTGFEHVMIWPGLEQYQGCERKLRVFIYESVYGKDEKVRKIREELQSKFEIAPPEILSMPTRLDNYLASSGVVVTPWGMTTCEAMFLGIPTITYNMNQYAENSAIKAAQNGAIYLTEYQDHSFVGAVIHNVTFMLLELEAQLNGYSSGGYYTTMSEKSQKLVDGKGCERIAKRLEEANE